MLVVQSDTSVASTEASWGRRATVSYPFEALLEGIKLALNGRLQKMPHIQVDIVLLVVVCDSLVGPFGFQVNGFQALTKVCFLLYLQSWYVQHIRSDTL